MAVEDRDSRTARFLSGIFCNPGPAWLAVCPRSGPDHLGQSVDPWPDRQIKLLDEYLDAKPNHPIKRQLNVIKAERQKMPNHDENHIYHPINQFRLMRRFYENWPDLKDLIPKLYLKNDDDVRPKLLEAMNSIEKNAVGRFEMISQVLKITTYQWWTTTVQGLP